LEIGAKKLQIYNL